MMKHISDADLEALLNDLESDCVERKESFSGGSMRQQALQAVCAFANDFPNRNEPGILFIGAKDDGTPSGLPITDDLLLQLADMRNDGKILPMPVLNVEKRQLKGSEMAVVTVLPSDMPPVRHDGRIWIRTGPRQIIANAQEESILSKDFPNRLTVEKTNKINILIERQQACDGATTPVGQATASLQCQPGLFFQKNLKIRLTSIDKNDMQLSIFSSKFFLFFGGIFPPSLRRSLWAFQLRSELCLVPKTRLSWTQAEIL